MHTGHNGHEVSIRYFHGGIAGVTGRPTMGSWIVYGLGNESDNLPAYMVLSDPDGHPVDGTHNWSSGFMPPLYQGTVLRPKEPRIPNLVPQPDLAGQVQRANLDLLAELNRRHATLHPGEADLESRIAGYELASRMQTAAAEALDVSKEPQEVRRLYGLDQDATREYGTRCRIARRLVERGVRFVQLFLGGQPWDNHDKIFEGHKKLAGESDQAIAALLTDLEQHGLLDETLVLWGGEFGRTPTVELPQKGANEGTISGRDHNHWGFTVWLAGGGVKGGQAYGATDEFGFKSVENRVHVHDLHATMLQLMGFDHTKLTYRYAGRDFRLTDVHGRVIPDWIA